MTGREEIAKAIRHINDSINGCGYNFREDTEGRLNSIAFNMSTDSDHSIIVLASFDFSYYHNLELVFYDAGYSTLTPDSTWWDHWTKDQLELREENLQDSFAFRFNRGTNGDLQFIIHAKAFSYHLGSVSNRR